MVSSKIIKLGTPFARGSLLALSISLMVDAILLIIAGWQYPFLIGRDHDFYLQSIHTISTVFISVSLVAIGIAISGSIVSYRYENNYLLVHAGLAAIFLPVLILVFFGSLSARYKPKEYENDYLKMIVNYGLRDISPSSSHNQNLTNELQARSFRMQSKDIDHIQSNFSCCGLESAKDWTSRWNGFIPRSCCNDPKTGAKEEWSKKFNSPIDYEFSYCDESQSYRTGCMLALKEHEYGKNSWIYDLIVIMVVIIIGQTVVSFLLFGLTKSDKNYENTNADLSMIGAMATMHHRASQPTIIGLKSRPSVVFSLANSPSPSEQLFTARLQSIRANLNNIETQTGPVNLAPRLSISSGSKFSAAARRGSSFI